MHFDCNYFIKGFTPMKTKTVLHKITFKHVFAVILVIVRQYRIGDYPQPSIVTTIIAYHANSSFRGR